ncbi:MAG: hypothetical protein ACO3YY_12860, partial [Phycisphaerales bacterium]
LTDNTNIRAVERLLANGEGVDRDALPTVRVFTRDVPAAAGSARRIRSTRGCVSANLGRSRTPAAAFVRPRSVRRNAARARR